MTEYSWFWDGTATGDANQAPYSSTEFSAFMRYLLNSDRTLQGPIGGFDSELAVSGAASPLTVGTGVALVLGKLYQNTAALAVANPTPGVARTDSIILRADLTAQTIRAVWKTGAFGVAPTMTQTAATWEIRLADITISAAGIVSAITDKRNFARTPLAAGYEWAYLAADDPDFTATAWNDLNGGLTMTITAGTWLIWGQVKHNIDGGTAGTRYARIYDNTSAGYVSAAFNANSGEIPLPPRIYTVTSAAVLALQYYAASATDTVYGGLGNNTDDYTTMIALRVA